MQEIIIEPHKLWDYIQEQDSSGQLDNIMYEIAKNNEYGISIYVSKNKADRYYISVEADDCEIHEEDIHNREDTERICRKIYDNFLTDRVIEIITDMTNDDWSALRQMDAIDIREEELNNCVTAFIMDVLGSDTYFDGTDFDDIVEDCKEHFLEYMARKHKFSIYRPMILEDEDGEDFFEEYPYECIEFEDEDNPIYKP